MDLVTQLAIIYRQQRASLTVDLGRRFEGQGLREGRPELDRGIYRYRRPISEKCQQGSNEGYSPSTSENKHSTVGGPLPSAIDWLREAAFRKPDVALPLPLVSDEPSPFRADECRVVEKQAEVDWLLDLSGQGILNSAKGRPTSQSGNSTATLTAQEAEPNPHSSILLGLGTGGKISRLSNILLKTASMIWRRSTSSWSWGQQNRTNSKAVCSMAHIVDGGEVSAILEGVLLEFSIVVHNQGPVCAVQRHSLGIAILILATWDSGERMGIPAINTCRPWEREGMKSKLPCPIKTKSNIGTGKREEENIRAILLGT